MCKNLSIDGIFNLFLFVKRIFNTQIKPKYNSMKSLRIYLLLSILLSLGLSVEAQKHPTLTKTMYSYTFSGTNSTTNIEALTNEITNLKGVTTCKPILKPEQNTGQLIVIVEEYTRSSEGEDMFEPTDLKKIIIKNGLVPNELTTEQLIK